MKIEYFDECFTIDTTGFHYSLIENMYITGPGESLQPGLELSEEEENLIKKECGIIFEQVKGLSNIISDLRRPKEIEE